MDDHLPFVSGSDGCFFRIVSEVDFDGHFRKRKGVDFSEASEKTEKHRGFSA
jgi:hypothetical protein